jgi:hypothetical protein
MYMYLICFLFFKYLSIYTGRQDDLGRRQLDAPPVLVAVVLFFCRPEKLR